MTSNIFSYPVAIPPNIPTDANYSSMSVNTLAPIQTNGPYTTWKISVRLATTAEITKSGLPIIDGVQVVDGDRILVKDPNTSGGSSWLNGIYIASAYNWNRSDDFPDGSDAGGNVIYVEQGAVNGRKFFVCVSTPSLVGFDYLQFNNIPTDGILSLNSGQIFVGNLSNIAQARTMSGSATLSSSGVLTLSNVNANVGTFGPARVTVGSDGRIVAASSAIGGSNQQVQYNNGGILGGSSNFTFNGTSITVGGNVTLTNGSFSGLAMNLTKSTLIPGTTIQSLSPVGPLTTRQGTIQFSSSTLAPQTSYVVSVSTSFTISGLICFVYIYSRTSNSGLPNLYVGDYTSGTSFDLVVYNADTINNATGIFSISYLFV
jgi:hypothetical protein